MKRLWKQIALVCAAVFIMASCADNTGTLGILEDTDKISTSTDIYEVTTRSEATGAIIADNTYGYLGKVIDPETGATIIADCAAQFYCHENYALPPKKQMVGEITINPESGDTTDIKLGEVKCDSCEVRIYLKSYYGEGNNPMKLEVYRLDEKSIMDEATTYYSDTDLTKYIKDSKPIATKVFTAEDYILNESERESSTHTDNIRIMLPASFGQELLEKCYASPSSLKDAYHFIREIFPGFYFRIANGEGTMLTTLVSTLNIYYNYVEKDKPKKIYQGITRFAATPEVLQSTRFENGNMEALINETEHTYLKTPAGICTEMTLPIDEIFDEHPTDSVSMAQITLTRYNKKSQDKYQLGTPTSLLMVRKENMKKFFENNEVADNRTSYVANFDNTKNVYSFTNICRLLSYCKHEKVFGAAVEGITEQEWAAKHPDWNKVMLVPVVTSSNSSGNLTSVNHDMGMNSICLVGGDTKLKMQVIYSKFSGSY